MPASAAATASPNPNSSPTQPLEAQRHLFASYLGFSFALFLFSLPREAVSYVASLQSRSRILASRLLVAEERLRRGGEAPPGWREAESRLLDRAASAAEEAALLRERLDEAEAEVSELRITVAGLEKAVAERDELLELVAVARSAAGGGVSGNGEDEDEEMVSGHSLTAAAAVATPYLGDDAEAFYQHRQGFGREFYPMATMPHNERSQGWKDPSCRSDESIYSSKHNVPRREPPWKLDLDSAGVSAKFQLLEQDLVNLEKLGTGDSAKIPSVAMWKHAKRYQSIAGKIDELCKRMQTSDPCDTGIGSETRMQRQREFLLEAFHLQHRATETRQKLGSLRADALSGDYSNKMTVQARLSFRQYVSAIQNNFMEIQRNLEVWLARILGDLEGALARETPSRMAEYFVSPYASVR